MSLDISVIICLYIGHLLKCFWFDRRIDYAWRNVISLVITVRYLTRLGDNWCVLCHDWNLRFPIVGHGRLPWFHSSSHLAAQEPYRCGGMYAEGCGDDGRAAAEVAKLRTSLWNGISNKFGRKNLCYILFWISPHCINRTQGVYWWVNFNSGCCHLKFLKSFVAVCIEDKDDINSSIVDSL